MRRTVRWVSVITVLAGLAIMAARSRPISDQGSIVVGVAKMLPPLFPVVSAQGPGPTKLSCTGTPKPNDPLIGGLNGQLSIGLTSLSLVNTSNVEKTLLSGNSSALNFANNSGTNVGNFISNASIETGTYNHLKGTVSATITILCPVVCNADGTTKTWVTKGGSQFTDADGVFGAGAAAAASTLTLSSASTFDLTLNPAITVSQGATTSKSLKFGSSSGCEMWDISVLKGHAVGTDFKIMPASQSPNGTS